MGPDFLVIGAQKGGTAWLQRNLQAHPGIWMSPEKELHYFDLRRHEPHGFVGRLTAGTVGSPMWRRQARRQWAGWRADRDDPGFAWHARLLFGRYDLDWYRRMFAPSGDRLGGEATPDYGVMDAADVRVVRSAFPDLRQVLVLRNPIERLWSQARMVHRLRAGVDPTDPADMLALEHEDGYGDYLASIANWGDAYGGDRLFIGFTEDVARHARQLINAITDHLDLPRHDRYPQAGRVVHHGGHDTVPLGIAVALAEGLTSRIREQADFFGPPADWWAFAADRLVAGDVDQDPLPLPLTTSSLWDAWVSSGRAGPDPEAFRSGRLRGFPGWRGA